MKLQKKYGVKNIKNQQIVVIQKDLVKKHIVLEEKKENEQTC